MIRTALFSWRGPSPSYGQFLLWAGSVLYARRIFPRVVLVADKAGQGWLVDILKLPFDEVLDLPDWPAELNHVYELPKLHAYAALCRAGKPFVHIDCDAFLRRRPPDDFLRAPAVCEHLYANKNFLSHVHARMTVKGVAQNPVEGRGAAGGLMGGCATDELGPYAENAIAGILHPQNRAQIRRESGYQASCYFGECAFYERFAGRISPLIGHASAGGNDYWRAGWMHLAGRLKREPGAITRAELQVMSDHGIAAWQHIRDCFDLMVWGEKPHWPGRSASPAFAL